MILWNQTKAAVAAVATVALVLGGVAAGVHAVAAQQSSSRSVQVNAAAPPRPAVETIETQDMIFAISPDRKELAAFATVTGEWEPLPDASAGAGGARSEIRNTIVLAQGVGAYVDDRRAYGFSGVTGKWDSVAIENPPAPGPGGGCTVAQDVAAYPDGNRVHAYAAPVGKWDTLTLPREGGPPEVVISQEIVRVRHGKTFHTFSAKTGKWTQPPFQIQSP